MKVSLNTIRQYVNFELPPVDELVARINEQLGGVEEVVDIGAKYKGIVIAKVVKCEPHPDSDHLHVCEIDIGDYPLPPTVERLPSNLIQVVCGAPNVHADMFVAWLPPGATVPASFDKEPFVLDVRKIRGVESNGMLASSAELAIGDNHDGIVEIDTTEWKPTGVEIAPGVDFARAYGLDDTIIDIENKMFTHRPDLFGQLGVAREIAGIQQQPFVSPEWYLHPVIPTVAEESSPNAAEDSSASPLGSGSAQNDKQLELTVSNDAGDKVPRFMAVAIKDIEIKPSPLWLQCALVAMGGKPINNIVDVTNYVMLLTAQPTHAYDYDKLRGHKIGARMAKQGEQLPLLNGKTYTLEADDIVIVDGEGPVGLGGIMGGGNSEVSASTKNIVLEVANFDMYTVRKSSMRHGLFTDALTRFNKGQSPLQNDRIIALLMQSVFDVAGGSQASNVFDEWNLESRIKNQEVEVSSQFINDRLGLALDVQQIQMLLENVEFTCTIHDTSIKIQPPFWRTDIDLPEDIVEEVGRLYGFDKLPRELPLRSMKPAPKNPNFEMKRKLAKYSLEPVQMR
ncbi:phenylalanine--tRNA ligase subunit beta [Candidatus Saccharibacteria bacterium]|nr:MAG: phenylalanine--tRNA ligase subunit beta [Candidatus Saccharibacteria bacterium]